MSGRSRVERIAASPTVVGAITTLIIIVAVFLAYNASNGLPFVPVYRVSTELPNAARVVRNNEVRIGGHRVGVVESVQTTQNQQTGEAAAKLNLKLDRAVKPISQATQVRVRYKSSFGLKFLELVPRPGPDLPEGGTLPITQSVPQTEFDAINNTFDTPTRENIRTNLENFGNAFAARGASLNQAIENLNPLFTNLQPVARKLVEPSTKLKRFFPALARSAKAAVPVAAQQSQLFTNMATTFGALAADPKALRDTITSGVPALESGIRTLPFQRVFLGDFAEFSRLLKPGARQLRLALPTLNDALAIGTPVLLRTPKINRKLEDVFHALNTLVSQPETGIALSRLNTLLGDARPTAEYLAPYQTVCNYFNYWFTMLPEHITQQEALPTAGTSQRIALVNTPRGQTGGTPIDAQGGLGGYTGIQANGRAGMFNPDPSAQGEFRPHELPILHGSTYGPSGTAAAPDCQSGQTGYPLGKGLVASGSKARYLDNGGNYGSEASPVVVQSDLPGARGRTGAYFHQNGSRDLNHVYPLTSP
ncbi:MAG: phospholipid/cholesterol/gamma-HCH transport system substrate-binding protein [Solirubrobacterales bacterium]|nr:phospholipid/cholesterol/gamma-HCH transport system substrate-binding protein [Solirubrobacterales bacterium]